MDRFDKIVTGVSIPFASIATFVVGLYSPFMSFWLAAGLVVSVSALMFAGIVVLPRARRTRSTLPDSIVRYLFALVLTCGIVMMFVAMVIFGIGVFIWLRFGEYDRVAFAIQEGTPFLILTIVLWVAAFRLLRVRLWGWWQALVGSLGAIAHGIYRYSLFPAFIPGNASPVPWLSSNPGAWLTTVLGWIVLVQLTAAFPLFRQEATAVSSLAKGQISNYASSHPSPGSYVTERPTAAFVLSLLAGIFILLGGALLAAIGAAIFAFVPTIGLVIGVVGLAFGILVLVGAVMLYMRPDQHVTWGVIILVFSILSIFTALGGFLIGLILGIVGGALAIAWKPRAVMFPGYGAGYPAGFATYGPPPPVAPPGYAAAPPGAQPSQPITPEAPAFCKNCGAPLSPGVQFCPSCGMKVGN